MQFADQLQLAAKKATQGNCCVRAAVELRMTGAHRHWAVPLQLEAGPGGSKQCDLSAQR